ncbi:hypothetical protein P872_17800 [Rhodonellum psychrophilum GCM71 = DSM 17998]|uniref:Uncharacterized protein n=1 Tax=Rhodonellum psychrophilum GCM71 = DSM 17998 TaxID=1123057 RepID=U5BY39_9BACT|nr:hypothetical protein P872_17800 [Rhodonellum psychrophilum GCM71 = DSM 17998]
MDFLLKICAGSLRIQLIFDYLESETNKSIP